MRHPTATRVATRYLQASAEDIVTQWLRSPAGVKVIETDLKMVMARDVEYIQNRSLDYHIDDDRVAGRAKKWLMGLSSFSNAISVGATGLEDKLVALIESTAGRAVHGAKVGKYRLSAETNKGELWLFWEGAVFGSPGTEDEEAERGTSGPDQDILDRAFVGAGFTDVRFEVDNDGPVTPSMDENDEFYWVYTVKLDLAVPLKRFLDQVPTKDLIGMARSVPKMANALNPAIVNVLKNFGKKYHLISEPTGVLTPHTFTVTLPGWLGPWALLKHAVEMEHGLFDQLAEAFDSESNIIDKFSLSGIQLQDSNGVVTFPLRPYDPDEDSAF